MCEVLSVDPVDAAEQRRCCTELGLSSAAAGASVNILLQRYRAPPIPHVSHAFTCSQTEVGASVARSLNLLLRNPRRHTHALARLQCMPLCRVQVFVYVRYTDIPCTCVHPAVVWS